MVVAVGVGEVPMLPYGTGDPLRWRILLTLTLPLLEVLCAMMVLLYNAVKLFVSFKTISSNTV